MDDYGVYGVTAYPQSHTHYHQLCSCPSCAPRQTYPQPLPYSQVMHDSPPSAADSDEKPVLQPQISQTVLQPQISQPVLQPQIPQPPAPTYQFPAALPHPQLSNPTWQMIAQAYGQPVMPGMQHPFAYHHHHHYQAPIPQAHFGYMPLTQQHFNHTSAPVNVDSARLPFDQFIPTPSDNLGPTPLSHYHNDLSTGLSAYTVGQGIQAAQVLYGALGTSPTASVDGSHSASSDDWSSLFVDGSPPRTSFDSINDFILPMPASIPIPTAAVSNPGLTLHIRSESNSSQDDAPLSATSLDSFVYIDDFPAESPGPHTFQSALARSSPEDSSSDPCCHAHPPSLSSSPKEEKASPASSPQGSPRTRQKRSSNGRSTRAIAKKHSPVIGPKTSEASIEKKVGRRKGPLRPEQRRQAGEIRKLRACLRCKFLKKTCDPHEICAGCKPSHARLWQVPCTRIDIKDLGYFIKGWDADFERYADMRIPDGIVLDYGKAHSRPLWISHGYGYCFSMNAREVFVQDSHYLIVDWHEASQPGTKKFNVSTSSFAPTQQGVSHDTLNDYLDAHVDKGQFGSFVEKHFQGTKFLSEMLMTAHGYYAKTKNGTVKKALKLVVAYNLTTQVPFLEGETEDGIPEGRFRNPASLIHGKQIAPVLINYAICSAMGQLWRELQKDVLDELSSLFQSVYTGDKLKNWPTIFIVGTLLLAVWEEMQFDAQYREPDEATVHNFLEAMETTPVGVITGLFAAISQKVPAFTDWNSAEHQHILGSDKAACDVMTEVRGHVEKHEGYLQTRSECKFDKDDFDCLSNKFLSKLVIKP